MFIKKKLFKLYSQNMTFVYFSFLLLLGVYPTPFNLFKSIIQELKQQFQEGQETN